MKETGTLGKQRGQPLALLALVLTLLMLLPSAGCKQASAPPSRPSEKGEHSQPPATAPAPVEARAPAQSVPEGPRFAVQVAAFEGRADAEALAYRLSEQYGLQTLVAPVEVCGDTLYRVRLLVRNKNEAKRLAKTFLRRDKLEVWIVRLP